ncbi:MAG: cysteine--tRNA ligase [Candidatus Doudnabacteria bacterium]|nr:cysteine--tRNA ligase [Candidatus Doudnabacteria bacterium]
MKLYNTLSKQLEEVPKKDHLNVYTCGPTVYNYAHIGNLRSYIVADLLFRSLKHEGFNPKWVMNITDIDDKTIKGTVEKYGAQANVENLREFTKFYYDEFLKDLHKVKVSVEDITFVRVTDVIPQIQEFIVELINKGYAYKAEDGSVYFSIEKYQKDFNDYGELVGEKFLEGKKVGARVAVDEYEKDNLSDFALWKAHNSESDAQIFWDHPLLGKGRPGWHIECSVINRVAFSGEVTDIHTGGVDLIFPHHTNEIAQSQALLGKGNFVKHWCHCEHLMVDDKKMAKRDGKFLQLSDMAEKVPLPGEALRYLFTQSSYRMRQNFTWESFLGAYKAVEKLFNTLASHKIIGENQPEQADILKEYLAMAKQALDDDMNIPAFVAALWESFGHLAANLRTQDEIAKKFDEVLGLGLINPPSILENIELPEAAANLVKARQAAREAKDFAKSDELRKEIEALGFEVKDTAEGQKIRKKISI